MTTIQISHNASAAAVARVQALLSAESMNNPNWNGADFKIERDDYTCIPDDDSANACALLIRINRAIHGE